MLIYLLTIYHIDLIQQIMSSLKMEQCIMFSMFSLQFRLVLNTVRMHVLETLFSFYRLKLQLVSSSIRLHTTLFPKFSLQFQNFTSDRVRMYHFTVPVFKNIRLGWPTTSCPPPSFNTNSQIRSWLHCDYMLVVVLQELICMTVACTNVILQRLVCLHGQKCIV